MSRQPTRRRRIRRFAVVAAVGALAASTGTPAAAGPSEGTIRAVGSSTVVKDSYIVVFKNSAVSRDRVARKSRELASRFGGRVGHTYADALRGFEVELPAVAARRLAADPSVEYVQENSILAASTNGSPGHQSPASSWGLDRIDQREQPLDNAYNYPTTGFNVKVYVVDSGIRLTHTEFGGRAISGIDVVDGDAADDFDGHGTRVAGIVGGQTYGVAKDVTLVGVRIYDSGEIGNVANAIAGINWVTADHQPGQPAVANLSFSNHTANSAMDAAVTGAIADGVTVVAAADNNGTDACTASPGRVPAAITVGATNPSDERYFRSNIGSCLDLFAPGRDILTAGIENDTATATDGGTSMAAPHVAGVAALILRMYPFMLPQHVRDYIVNQATVGVVTNAGAGSPNRLLYMNPLWPMSVLPLPDRSTAVNAPVSAQLAASGGYQPYLYTASGLPSGLALNPSSGAISGAPTVTGQFNVVATIRDSQGQLASRSFTWTVTERETRQYEGFATATKPTTALTMAANQAKDEAAADGFGQCETLDSWAALNEFRSYDAWVKLLCVRL
jgi:subtilisin family serine protease